MYILPVDPLVFLNNTIQPCCKYLTSISGRNMDHQEAEVILLASAIQETRLRSRLQRSADNEVIFHLGRGFWQFEGGKTAAIGGLMTHPATEALLRRCCKDFGVPFLRSMIHEAVAWHDDLACCLARLLFYSDPERLPALGQCDPAMDYYHRCWRPGKRHPEHWPKAYDTAMAIVTGDDEWIYSRSSEPLQT